MYAGLKEPGFGGQCIENPLYKPDKATVSQAAALTGLLATPRSVKAAPGQKSRSRPSRFFPTKNCPKSRTRPLSHKLALKGRNKLLAFGHFLWRQ
jgi:hypothetical protein